MLAMLVSAYCLGASAAADSGAPRGTAPTERDFRAKPFQWKEEIEESNLTPLVDREFLVRRLERLFTPVGHWESYRYVAKLLRPVRNLTYHAVIRYEAPDANKGFVEVHIPEASGSQSTVPKDALIYHEALKAALDRIAKLGDLEPEVDGSRAALLFYVNLAERRQTSEGFDYESMPRLPARVRADSTTDLAVMEYALPWTFVRMYFVDRGISGSKIGNSVDGGEIWIQYPKRTFWQAEVAQAAMDDIPLSIRRGLGSTRESIVARFRTPHKTPLLSLKEALAPLRSNVWFGSGGLVDLRAGTAPRPGETLLSRATGQLQAKEGTIYEFGGPESRAGRCGEGTHSRVLANRLERAAAIFIGGVEAGAVRVAPLGDYTTIFRNDPDGVLADFSLADYKGSFDQRLDDRLILMALQEMRAVHGGKPLQDISLPLPISARLAEAHLLAANRLAHRIIGRGAEDVRNAFRDVALGFTLDGGACMHSMELH